MAFNDVEKFVLDQYVLHGGKVIWLIDELIAELDSMQKYGNIMTADYQLRLDDMLFKYGARLNLNLIQDLQCHVLPFVKTSTTTGEPQRKFYPWIFYPVYIPDGQHPIVRNLEGVWSRFWRIDRYCWQQEDHQNRAAALIPILTCCW